MESDKTSMRCPKQIHCKYNWRVYLQHKILGMEKEWDKEENQILLFPENKEYFLKEGIRYQCRSLLFLEEYEKVREEDPQERTCDLLKKLNEDNPLI